MEFQNICNEMVAPFFAPPCILKTGANYGQKWGFTSEGEGGVLGSHDERGGKWEGGIPLRPIRGLGKRCEFSQWGPKTVLL